MFYYFLIFSVVAYLILVLWLWRGWTLLQRFDIAGVSVPVSVVIHLRNEASNIANILSDIANQHYSQELIQVVVVDDHSTDGSAEVVDDFARERSNVTLLHLPDGKHGKQVALCYALPHLTGTLVVTTNAGCRATPRWLPTIAAFYTTYRPALIICPVMLTYNHSFSSRWKALQLIMLTGFSAGAAAWREPVMCSDANMAMERTVMNRCTSPVVSNDDTIISKIRKNRNNRIFFLKSTEATVETSSIPDLTSFGFGFALIVFIANLAIVTCLIAGFFQTRFLWLAAILWTAKMLVDYPLLTLLCRFWKHKKLMNVFIPSQLLYSLYVISYFVRLPFSPKQRYC